jgi:hypothetical protein
LDLIYSKARQGLRPASIILAVAAGIWLFAPASPGHLLSPALPSESGAGVPPVNTARGIRVAHQTNSVPKRRLWPGSRFTEEQRKEAIIRALKFIYENARKPENFAEFGSDYLWCFYTISASVNDEDVRNLAQEMGAERARLWRQQHSAVPASAGVNVLLDLMFGSDGANSLGFPDERLKLEIQTAVRRFGVPDFFSFDPRVEPPPGDVPDECRFDHTVSPRGSHRCLLCGRRLRMRSRYDVWCEALVTAYTARHFGVSLGADYLDLLKWLPRMRPYLDRRHTHNQDFIQSVYAVTHVIYTLNDYDQSSLDQRLLPDEYRFLKGSLRVAIARRDLDMLGELMDSLKSLGLSETDPAMRLSTEYLLAHQNADGSWGNPKAKDNYDRYHPTWNGIVALSNYSWSGSGPKPDVLKFLNNLADLDRRRN